MISEKRKKGAAKWMFLCSNKTPYICPWNIFSVCLSRNSGGLKKYLCVFKLGREGGSIHFQSKKDLYFLFLDQYNS